MLKYTQTSDNESSSHSKITSAKKHPRLFQLINTWLKNTSNQLGLYINLIVSYHNHCLSCSVLQEAPKDKGNWKYFSRRSSDCHRFRGCTKPRTLHLEKWFSSNRADVVRIILRMPTSWLLKTRIWDKYCTKSKFLKERSKSCILSRYTASKPSQNVVLWFNFHSVILIKDNSSREIQYLKICTMLPQVYTDAVH